MGLLATPFAAHAAIAAPAPAVRVGAPAAGRLGAVWPTRLSAPWPLPDAGIAVAGRPARLFTEGAVAVVRGVTAADVAAGLRYLASRIEQGAEAVVQVDAEFACEAERVSPVFVPARAG
jgi:hypothetical protein